MGGVAAQLGGKLDAADQIDSILAGEGSGGVVAL
jgi:hypothetical protein